MSKRKREEEAVSFPGFEPDKSKARKRLMEISEKYLSELQDLVSFDPQLSGSVDIDVDTSLDGFEDESEAQRRPQKMQLKGPHLQGLVEELLRADKLCAEQKNQLDSHTSPPASSLQRGLVSVDSNAPPSSSTQPPPIPPFPRFPKGGTTDDVLNWRRECNKISSMICKEDSDNNHPTLRALEDRCTTDNDVQDWRSKLAVLAAARSIVSVTPISEDGPTGKLCTGFILHRFEHSGVVFSVIVTCSAVLRRSGRKLDPLPKLSVGLPDKKTVIEAQLLYFDDHFDIAFLLLPLELSLDIPCIGCCPDYNQEVFVLGRDREGSLGARRGVISWTEESDFIGRDHYMFLDGEVPEGGTGGPVIDHDGMFRGMAFNLSPEPAVLSISTIMTCFAMFQHSGRIARPMLGLNLRSIASVDVEHLECLFEQNIKSGYIVAEVHDNSPARVYEICKGCVILSLNGRRMLSLPKLEDYLLSLGWKNLINSDSTIDLKLTVCDLEGRRKNITMPVGFCSLPECKSSHSISLV